MTDPIAPPAQNVRNPYTHKKYRQEVLWQIALPFLVGLILVITLIVLANFGSNGQVNSWSMVSQFWLIIPVCFFSLIFLAFNIAFIYAITRLLAILPPYTRIAQDFFTRMQHMTRRSADAASLPVLKTHAALAGLRAARDRLPSIGRRYAPPATGSASSQSITGEITHE
jgi:uncharacterized membrane protein